MLKAPTHDARMQAIEIAQTEPTSQCIPPAVDSSQRSLVQQYLIQQKELPANMVQALHGPGLVYVEFNQNAVFRMRSLTEETTGAFLRGTRGEHTKILFFARKIDIYQKGTAVEVNEVVEFGDLGFC
ncbi:DUF3991 domain-containing protein [Tolypothrix campylonemoides VB511288_2]